MPHVRLRGIKLDQALKFSEGFKTEAAKTLKTDPDHFTIELIHSQFIHEGTVDPGYPIIEVMSFARPLETESLLAKQITDRMKRITGPGDVAVIFIQLEKTGYFENGEHF